ncbi:uncharacterized protein [Asterias amurensis]|uniref:uncharacterized protein n=1 Tax=Asterias amurensis TaxID=7602 RepID=UPI003AB6E41B
MAVSTDIFVAAVTMYILSVVPPASCTSVSPSIPSMTVNNQTTPCKLYNVTMFDCSARNLSATPIDIPITLTHLDISINRISNLTGFNFLSSLKTLNCSINIIQAVVGSDFQGLISLQILDLSQNSISFFADNAFIWLQNLVRLDLSSNYIVSIPTATFEGLGEILELSLRLNDLTEVPSDALANLRKIETLDLSFNQVKQFELGLGFQSLRNLSKLVTLEKLDLSLNQLKASGMTNETFSGLHNLEELHLSDNHLNEVPRDALTPFNVTGSLRRLNLAGNSLISLNADDFASVPFLTSLNLERNGIYNLDNCLDNLQNLKFLYLANNQFYRLPPAEGWVAPLRSLRLLDTSHNPGGEYLTNTLSTLAPALEEMYVSNIRDDFELSILLNCTLLITLDVSHNGLTDNDFYTRGLYGWSALNLPKLKTLNLAGNAMQSLRVNVFQRTPRLRWINCSRNSIEDVDGKTFENTTDIRFIDLSENQLTNLSALSPSHLPNLHSAIFSGNKISFVDVELLKESRLPSLSFLDLSHNPFSCTCDVQDFNQWIIEDVRVFLPSPFEYKCNSPSNLQGYLITQLVFDQCVSHLALYLGVSSAAALICIFTVTIFCVRYHWHLRYKWFLLFPRRRLIRREVREENSTEESRVNNNPPKFDAFVSYNDHDQEWVVNQLIPRLEEDPNEGERFRLCVSERDIDAGGSRTDAVVGAIHDSRKTILVLSDHFMESEWCYYEMQMAHQRLFNEGQDVLILILLKDVSDSKMTLLLRQTLCRKTYFKWPHDNLGQQLFWDRLKAELKMRSIVNRRVDTQSLSLHPNPDLHSHDQIRRYVCDCLNVPQLPQIEFKMAVSTDIFVAAVTMYMLSVVTPASCTSVSPSIPSMTAYNQTTPCKLYNVTMFDCSARNLSATPIDIPITLTHLDISINRISNLTGFNFLSSLKTLNCSINIIQAVVGSAFQGLVSLQILDLSQNSISVLADNAFIWLQNLVRLDLSSNYIVSIPTATFEGLGEILELSLWLNDLKEVPSDALANLRKIETLDLSFNQVKQFELGLGFQSLRNLKRLLLFGMNIEFLANSTLSALSSLPLEYIDFSLNVLVYIDTGAFYPVQNIKGLSLRETSYQIIDALPSGLFELDLSRVDSVVSNGVLTVRIAESLSRHLPKVTSISFAENKIRWIEDSALGKLVTLEKLDLSLNQLKASGMTNETFSGLHNLEELHLSDNHLNEVPRDALTPFNVTGFLRRLNLAGNSLISLNADDFASVPLLTSLNLERNGIYNLDNCLDNLQNLKFLYLANNQFYRLPPAEGWVAPLRSLRLLDMSHNPGGEYLTNTLSTLAPALEEMYVSNIRDDFELSVLLNCTSLITLDVSHNGLTDNDFYTRGLYGWSALNLPKLKTLNLAGNAMQSLRVNVFQRTPRLRWINCSRNSIEDVDGKTFKNTTDIRFIDLSENQLTNLSALSPSHLPNLHSAIFSGNKISFVDVELLKESRLPSLSFLDLSHNPFSCTCDVRDFNQWIIEDVRVFLPSPFEYKCNSPSNLQGYLITQLVFDQCVSHLALYLVVSSAAALICIFTVTIFCVRYHWHLRYKWFYTVSQTSSH